MKKYLQAWRAKSLPPPSKPRRTLPNLRLVAFWLTKPTAQRSPEEQRWAEAVTAECSGVATVEQLAQQFRQVFKDRNTDTLKSWLAKSLASETPELKPFVARLQRDYLSGRCTVVADFCFCAGAYFPSSPSTISTLPDFHQKCGRPFQVIMYGRSWVFTEGKGRAQ